jgi:hypothetical protein
MATDTANNRAFSSSNRSCLVPPLCKLPRRF